MLKSNIKYLLFFFQAATFIITTPEVNGQSKTFETTFGTSANDLGNFVQQTADGGYIICGAAGNPGSMGYYDYSLTKIDAYGTLQWTKTIGDAQHDEEAQCVRQLQDSTYIVYGSRSGIYSSAAWLVKTDVNGNQQLSSEQQGSNKQRYGYSVLVAPEGGYQTASWDNVSSTATYFQLQKSDESGSIQWGPDNIVNGTGTASSVALTNDGDYIAVGTTQVDYDIMADNFFSVITLVKTSATGDLLWTKSYKATAVANTVAYLQGFGVTATSDGGYVICGSTTINTKGGTDIFMLKTDGNGDSLWSKNYGGIDNDYATSIKEAPGGDYVLTGNTSSFGSGSMDIFILRTSATGDSLWMRTFGGKGTETAGNIEVTSDSGFVVVGSTTSYGAGQYDILVLRTNSEGRIPDASVKLPVSMCSGSPAILSAIAGYKYLWNTGETTQSITVNQPGNYSITVTDKYGNVNTSKSIPVAFSNPVASASLTANGTISFCHGKSVDLIANDAPGCSYRWQVNGAPIQGDNARTFTVTEDGEYNVVVSNSCNAVASKNIYVHVLAVPPVPLISWDGTNLISSNSTDNQWYKDGVIVAGAVNAIFTPSGYGIYSVVTGQSGNCTSESEPFAMVAAGIETARSKASYLEYPNPATNIIYIDYDLQGSSGDYFVIYSSEGKEVYREKLNDDKGFFSITTAQWASGLYFSGIETQGAFAGKKTMAIINH